MFTKKYSFVLKILIFIFKLLQTYPKDQDTYWIITTSMQIWLNRKGIKLESCSQKMVTEPIIPPARVAPVIKYCINIKAAHWCWELRQRMTQVEAHHVPLFWHMMQCRALNFIWKSDWGSKKMGSHHLFMTQSLPLWILKVCWHSLLLSDNLKLWVNLWILYHHRFSLYMATWDLKI